MSERRERREPAYVVKGDDPLLRERVVQQLVDELLGDDDRTLALEEFTVSGRATESDDDARTAVVSAVINAASSPPFMSERRIVLVRDVGDLLAEHAQILAAYLDAPLPSTVLVFVHGGGRAPGTPPSALAKKLKEIGAVERAPASEKTSDVLGAAAKEANVKLRPDAAKLITSHLGEDAGRVDALVDVLVAAHGDGTTLGADDVLPYVGAVGSVPSYELTNAIEAGDTAAALEVLHRLLHASTRRDPSGMHPLQVLGILTGYYRRLLALDDPRIENTADAVTALGGRVKEYPARKALAAARALGTTGIRQAFDALHQADLDVKGARGIPADAVVEVLVARLARLSRVSSPAPARASGRRR